MKALRRLAAGAALTAATLVLVLGGRVPAASAQPCPDVEVIFARGTAEAPGVGGTGQAFVDALRSQIGWRTLGVYGVNYPASNDFANPNFPRTVVDGIRDATNRVQVMSVICPNTRLVLGGFSQGAMVSGFVTGDAVPQGATPAPMPPLLAPDVADNVAAVVLLGKPNGAYLSKYQMPPVVTGPLYAARTIELCAAGDPVCGPGGSAGAHGSYPFNGMVQQGAGFAATHL
ncbi:cutinase family protein [Mycobacterium sp. GA-2829]|uniref:cutinase family protein n=1 Tax=Mycobacterium sp. GA-2829 TaxID=1772283 RepID=UPI00073FD45F|nr:cutinase family protein [Mycobacterium sp. GA-2829]KUI30225.1 cutinase [Mycobacterium sp. GA-2829]